MKTIAMSLLLFAFLSASLTGWQMLVRRGSYVVGGEYILHSGDVVSGDLDALFAQVTVEDGARVDGRILSVSSVLDLAGSVTGKILAIESDITVRETARLLQPSQAVEAVPYVVLLPQMARIGNLGIR